VPLAVTVAGADVHDKCLVEPTLESFAVERPEPTSRCTPHLCAAKGYDYPDIRDLVAHHGYTAHIESRGDEPEAKRSIPGYRARR
jgi:hypothetical protein